MRGVLYLNIDTSGVGLVRVEIQDGRGNPIEGYGLDHCNRIHAANSTKHTVTWRPGDTDVSKLTGTPVRLRFALQFGVRLHSLRFGGVLRGHHTK